MSQLTLSQDHPDALLFGVKERSDKVMNYFLVAYFIAGLLLAIFYDTWFIAISVGSICLLAYYSTKLLLPDSDLYQYVLSTVYGIFMAQFIYQMHGMFEMHFFAFIGCAVLITYQNWKLQIPILVVVVFHHALFSYLQNIGVPGIYFTQLSYFDFRTFVIHIALTAVISFICGLWAFQLKKYTQLRLIQSIKMAEIQKEIEFDYERRRLADERDRILESIGDAFFAVNGDWIVTYWNNMAEKVLQVPRKDIIGKNLWDVFASSVGSESYKQYYAAVVTNQSVHFEDYYRELKKWYEISAYPAESGLSVFFKDITERKLSDLLLVESEKRYSDLFNLSPMPIWVFDLKTLYFLNVNEAAIKHYGYSRDEFMAMTIRDIRPKHKLSDMESVLSETDKPNEMTSKGVFTHKKKNGELIEVDVQSNTIDYKGRKARLVIAHDITDRLKYIVKMEKQNQTLKEISWMQSHIIRAPLVKIMGLIPLVQNNGDDEQERKRVLAYLAESANELDEVIKSINEKSDI
ncbi:MAG: PAS domain S-box protein [Mucilaginibacter sp.]